MTAKEAETYHAGQIRVFEDSAADMVTAITMSYVEEAIAIAKAAKTFGMPVVISFTVETDGTFAATQTEALRQGVEGLRA